MSSKEEKDNAAWEQQEEIVQSLKQLQHQVEHLPHQESAPQLSHYRSTPALPEAVQQSYAMLEQGAGLVHATSTKYTLMGKLDAPEQTKICTDFLQGCQYLATGCLALHDPVTGCSKSVRHHARQAVRAILVTTTQLVECFAVDHANSTQKESQIGARKTGAVWQSCNVILEKKMPVGNRNAMRRDLLTFKMECNETLTEFQEMIDRGPSLREEDEDEDRDKEETKHQQPDSSWEAFLDGDEDQYADHELPVAVACVAIIKCSRGSINATLQALEAVTLGEGGESLAATDKARLTWMSKLHDFATIVGNGMTDLGACLYPPLNLDSVETEVERQAGAIEQCVNHLVEATSADGEVLELSPEVKELASKLQTVIQTRRSEALEAISVCIQK